MNDPKHLSIADFDYHLPDSRIAAFPAANRHNSKLLIWQNEQISESTFRNLPHFLPSGAVMVLNNTRVVAARIIFFKSTGARIEVFCLEPADEYPDITTALAQEKTVTWKCLVGRASSWQHQTIIEKDLGNGVTLYAKIISKHSDHFLVQLSWIPENISFSEILLLAGSTPLPPYIKRKPEISDLERYQTIYADHAGSVAAPTAGLHFTNEVLQDLSAAAIDITHVTLHVGAGTFKPVKSEHMAEHEMHAEYIDVSKILIEKLIARIGSPLIAVGTTSTRTLESLYWIGLKLKNNASLNEDDLRVHQWEPYENAQDVSTKESLQAIVAWLEKNKKDSLVTKTSLMIAPPYKFRIVDILITNFHQPRSTLLLLVAAFIGDDWKRAYAYALDNDFRFLSYGDSCLLFKK